MFGLSKVNKGLFGKRVQIWALLLQRMHSELFDVENSSEENKGEVPVLAERLCSELLDGGSGGDSEQRAEEEAGGSGEGVADPGGPECAVVLEPEVLGNGEAREVGAGGEVRGVQGRNLLRVRSDGTQAGELRSKQLEVVRRRVQEGREPPLSQVPHARLQGRELQPHHLFRLPTRVLLALRRPLLALPLLLLQLQRMPCYALRLKSLPNIPLLYTRVSPRSIYCLCFPYCLSLQNSSQNYSLLFLPKVY